MTGHGDLAGARPGPVGGGFAGARPGPVGGDVAGPSPGEVRAGHPAVDAALQAMANAADLPPDDQIAQYEATHRILAETLATIDEG